MRFEKNRQEVEVPAGFYQGMLRQSAAGKALDGELVTRIEKIAQEYNTGSDRFAAGGERRENAFIRAMTRIIEFSNGDELVNRVLNGIGRTDERSLYNTALAIEGMIEDRPAGSGPDMSISW